MYDLPGRTDVGTVVIDADTVRDEGQPHARAARAGAPSAAPRGQLTAPSRPHTMTTPTALAYLDAHATYEKTGRDRVAVARARCSTLVAAMGDPQLTLPGHPRHRHQRQGLDGADDHPAADGPRPHASARTPARTSSASTSGSAATASRSATRTSPSRSPPSPTSRCSPACARRYFEIVDRGGVPLVRRRRRRRGGGRGRPARPLGRDQRRATPRSP